MCTVSAMLDHGRTRIPLRDWTRPAWTEFQEIIRRLEVLDQKLNQPDCVDPKKAEWMQLVEERLQKLEAQEAR